MALTEATVDVDGEPIFVRHAGRGPLVLLCHGFPETSVAWAAHAERLAGAGFHAAALDLRGHGRSTVPTECAAYSVLRVVGDLLAVAGSLGQPSFHLVGDDLGAIAAWHAALLRPDLVRSVTGISIPYFPRSAAPPDVLLHLLDTATETPYLLRFLDDDIEAEMAADPRRWIEGCLASTSGLVAPGRRLSGMVPRAGAVADVFIDGVAPTFVEPSLVDELVASYTGTGFAGSLCWYRRLVDDWPLLSPWTEARIDVPAMFIGGDVDPMRLIADGAIADLPLTAHRLVKRVQLPGVGHWPHLERPEEVAELLVGFLAGVEAGVTSQRGPRPR